MYTDFEKTIWNKIKSIPHGKISTYALVARAVGKPKSARAVGNALNKNPYSPQVPCHRVVKSDGTLGGFAGGTIRKREILEKEGVQSYKAGKMKIFKIKDFEKILYKF